MDATGSLSVPCLVLPDYEHAEGWNPCRGYNVASRSDYESCGGLDLPIEALPGESVETVLIGATNFEPGRVIHVLDPAQLARADDHSRVTIAIMSVGTPLQVLDGQAEVTVTTVE